ncbi:MAG: hypothetical protein RJA09_1769, partial [Pseudomonadota bacterium]
MSNSKPVLICLPGLMCDATVWQNQVQELTTEVRCL